MDARADEQLKDLCEWIASSDARQTAQRVLRQRGLPVDGADDLCQEVFARVAAQVHKTGPIPLHEGKSIAAYAATTMEHRATDMLRGSSRERDALRKLYLYRGGEIGGAPRPSRRTGRGEEIGDAPRPGQRTGSGEEIGVARRPGRRTGLRAGAFGAEAAEAIAIGQAVGAELVDELRSELLAAPERAVWPTSAALSLLTLAIDPERDDHLGPRPEGGVEGQWRVWTSLWLAGREDCFPNPPENQDDDARRQRRSRAIKQVTARLKDAHENVRDPALGLER